MNANKLPWSPAPCAAKPSSKATSTLTLTRIVQTISRQRTLLVNQVDHLKRILQSRASFRRLLQSAPHPGTFKERRLSQPLSQLHALHSNTHTNDSKSQQANEVQYESTFEPEAKRQKQLNAFQKAAPLADRMRPTSLDEICGQELVGPSGVLRGLIEQDRVPSMILWGSAGTGKTTIARVIASIVGSRFIEINSTSSGVAECKKIFAEARSELGLTGRKTIIFCDEIHRSVSAFNTWQEAC
jgi:predicted AAA+ superfamily ATPase